MDGKYRIILIIKQALRHAYCLSIAYFPGPEKYSAAKAIKNKNAFSFLGKGSPS